MLKTLRKAFIPVFAAEKSFLNPEFVLQQQLRTTFILKRKYPPPLHKLGYPPKRLRPRHYIYELVKDTSNERQPDLEVILVKYVEGLGNVGDRVSVRPNYAYNNLLLPGLAVYASPENIKKYENYEKGDEEQHSSPFAKLTMQALSRMTLSVIMNRETPWTLKPWHIRTSFRKCGCHVPEDAIKLPEKPITGPDMNKQDKEFYITVMINNLEKVNVRCRIHHWSTDIAERIPHNHEFWKKPTEPIFAADLPSAPEKDDSPVT